MLTNTKDNSFLCFIYRPWENISAKNNHKKGIIRESLKTSEKGNTKTIKYLAVTGQTKTNPSVKIRATVIPSEGYDYFRRFQGAWNHITTYVI